MADYARAELFRELRDAAHLSQEDAAHEIGVSVKTLRTWEGGGKIRWENAKKAAAFYKIDPERLVSRDLAPGTPDLMGSLGDAGQSQLDRIEAMLVKVLELLGDGAIEDLVSGALADKAAADARADARSGGRSGGKKAAPRKARAPRSRKGA